MQIPKPQVIAINVDHSEDEVISNGRAEWPDRKNNVSEVL